MRYDFILFSILAMFILASHAHAATSITWKETYLPMPEAAPNGLETLLVWPNDGAKHPLALISHGSPRDPKDRRSMTAISYLPIAKEFARRGFATAVVLRRGYGTSGGNWVEGFGSCDATDYPHAARIAAEDLQAAILSLSKLPQFDTSKMIAVGVSAGGFATVALTAINPPKGLVAAISFAGGRGSQSSDHVCQQDALIKEFGELGKTSHVPMLWVYAQNDHFFNASLAKQFYNAFTQHGGQAHFIEAKPYGDEGHFLFSNAGIAQWTPIVDQFLKNQHLQLVSELIPLSTTPLNIPTSLSVKAKKAFSTYAQSAPHKAFAVAENGSFGWRSGQRTVEQAKSAALQTCQQYSRGHDCKIIAVD